MRLLQVFVEESGSTIQGLKFIFALFIYFKNLMNYVRRSASTFKTP